jgi:hypothetical protein
MDSKLASKLWERAPQSAREKRSDVSARCWLQSSDQQYPQAPKTKLQRRPRIFRGNISEINEEENITVLHSRLTAVLEEIHIDHKIIFKWETLSSVFGRTDPGFSYS